MPNKSYKRPTAAEKREEALLAKVVELTTINESLRGAFNEIHAAHHALKERNIAQETLLGERSGIVLKVQGELHAANATVDATDNALRLEHARAEGWRGAAYAFDAHRATAMEPGMQNKPTTYRGDMPAKQAVGEPHEH